MQIVFCDCTYETIDSFPTISLVIDNIEYEIPPSTYVSTDSGTSCLIDVSWQRGWSVYILGLPLFENYYTVFDQEQKRIGFARSIHSEYVEEEDTLMLMSDEIDDCPRRATFLQALLIAIVPVIFWIIATKIYFNRREKMTGTKIDGMDDYVKA